MEHHMLNEEGVWQERLNEEGVWQELLHNKYLGGKTLSQVTAKLCDSQFWKALMSAREDFFSRGSFKIGNGHRAHFLEDTWRLVIFL
jgi:hypothetical protein